MRSLLALGIMCTLAACTDVKSSSIKTSGMSAHMHVTADGTGNTTATASLNVDDSAVDYIDLSPGDTLTASASGQTQPMSRLDVLNAISYSANFSGLDAENTQYTIALTRMSDTSAPASTATLPKPFRLTAPAAGQSFSRAGADIPVTWDAVGTDPMTYEITGSSCVQTVIATNIPGDSGSVTIPRSRLMPTAGSSTASCQITITIRRSRNGKLDSAYGYGGNIFAEQARTVTVMSTP